MEINVISVSAGADGGIVVSFELQEGEKRSVDRFLISLGAYTELSICVGRSSCEIYEAVAERAKLYGAYKHGSYLLGFSSCSNRMLYRKLVMKGFEPEISRMAVNKLEADGLLDEKASAFREAEKCVAKLWGETRIRAHLVEKGYREDAVEEAILLLIDAEVDFDENCFELLQKKYAPLPKDKKERQKIVASMMRYGYTLSQIKYAMVR